MIEQIDFCRNNGIIFRYSLIVAHRPTMVTECCFSVDNPRPVGKDGLGTTSTVYNPLRSSSGLPGVMMIVEGDMLSQSTPSYILSGRAMTPEESGAGSSFFLNLKSVGTLSASSLCWNLGHVSVDIKCLLDLRSYPVSLFRPTELAVYRDKFSLPAVAEADVENRDAAKARSRKVLMSICAEGSRRSRQLA
jgi:hypothetical protein